MCADFAGNTANSDKFESKNFSGMCAFQKLSLTKCWHK